MWILRANNKTMIACLLLMIIHMVSSQNFTRILNLTITPPSEEFISSVSFQFHSKTEDIIVYYTLDNTMPTYDASVTGVESTIVIDKIGVTVVRAFAHKEGFLDSFEFEHLYNIIDKCKDPVLSPGSGTFAGHVDVLVTSATTGSQLYYSLNASNPTSHSPKVPPNGIVSITSSTTLLAIAMKSGFADSHITRSSYNILPKVVTPIILPKTDTFAISATLTIVCDTPNSTIYYTTDGSDPTYLSLTYMPSITTIIVEGAGIHTLKAIATSSVMLQSDIATKTFKILERAAPPVYVPPSGQYFNSLSVLIKCADGILGGVVYYTTNALQTPTISSNYILCNTAISLSAPGTFVVRSFVAAEEKSPSSISEGTYVLKRPPYDEQLTNTKAKLQMHPDLEISVVAKNLEETTSLKRAYCSKRNIRGRVVRLKNPVGHFDILQPLNGCGNGLTVPSLSGQQMMPYGVSIESSEYNSIYKRHMKYYHKQLAEMSTEQLRAWREAYLSSNEYGCEVVSNGGFFDVVTSACLGDIVTNGRVVQTSTTHNVNFGIRNGSFVVGYVEPAEVLDHSNPFDTLISGLVWLVRNSKVYVEESISEVAGDGEDMSPQSTGPQFATILSARTAIGYNAEGHLMILQVEGESWIRGMSLYEFAEFAVELGFVSAVNLDGGGSASMTVNRTLVSEPSWKCSNYDNNIDDDTPTPATPVGSSRHSPGFSYGPHELNSYQIYQSLYADKIDRDTQSIADYRYCEKKVSSLTCFRSMPPPVENPWAENASPSPSIVPTKSPKSAPTATPTSTPTQRPTATPSFGAKDDDFLYVLTKSPTMFMHRHHDDDKQIDDLARKDDDDDMLMQECNTTLVQSVLKNQIFLYQSATGVLAIALCMSMLVNTLLYYQSKSIQKLHSNQNKFKPSPNAHNDTPYDEENPRVEMVSTHQNGAIMSSFKSTGKKIVDVEQEKYGEAGVSLLHENKSSDLKSSIRGRTAKTGTGVNWQKALSTYDFTGDESEDDNRKHVRNKHANVEEDDDDEEVESIPLYTNSATGNDEEGEEGAELSQSLLGKSDKKGKKSKKSSRQYEETNLMAADIDRTGSMFSKKKSKHRNSANDVL